MSGILIKSIPSIIIVLLGMLTITLLYYENNDSSFEENERRFNDFSNKYIKLVKNSLVKNLEYSKTYNTLANIVDNIIVEDFREFALDIFTKDIEIDRISYIPIVSKSKRGIFESYAQKAYNDSSLRIFYVNQTSNKKVIQKEKDYYYPILFGEIKDKKFVLPLFDTGEIPIRKKYFSYINQTCQSYLLPPAIPIQNKNTEELLIIYEPFYSQDEMHLPCNQRTLKGFTSISFFLSKLVLKAVNKLANEKISIHLYNVTNNDKLLLTSIINEGNKWNLVSDNKNIGSFENKEYIHILGQTWCIVIRNLDSFVTIKINIEELVIIGVVIVILAILAFAVIHYWDRKNILRLRDDNFKKKEEFIRYVLHEIRVPLNTITLGTNLLKYPPSSISRASIIKSIKDSSLRASTILNDIIDLENIENNRFEVIKSYIPITEIIRSSYMDNIYLATKRGIDFTFSITDEINDKALYCDGKRIIQCLNNIIGNAIKFTQDEGHIQINTKLIDLEKSFNIQVPESSAFNKDKGIIFEVIDDGIGIKNEEKDNVFVEYDKIIKNTKEEKRIGLGLSVANNLIKLHHGIINFESEHGKGSRFFFILPYCYNIIEDSESSDYLKGIGELRNINLNFKCKELKDNFDKESSKNFFAENIIDKVSETENVKILIVEDNKSNQQYLKSILELEGFNINVANNGEEAIKKAIETDFNIILMDNKMKPIDGITATKEILKLKPDQKIVGIIGLSVKEDVDNFLMAGAKQVFSKPLDFDILLGFIADNN